MFLAAGGRIGCTTGDPSELHRVAERRVQDANLVYTKGRRALVELLAGL